jgi:hypothetical protein
MKIVAYSCMHYNAPTLCNRNKGNKRRNLFVVEMFLPSKVQNISFLIYNLIIL